MYVNKKKERKNKRSGGKYIKWQYGEYINKRITKYLKCKRKNEA